MKRQSSRCSLALFGCIGLCLGFGTNAMAQMGPRDAIETLRADIKADRKAVIAEQVQFTEKESEAFWPLYREYRTSVDGVGDKLVKLVLEYADLYPNVSDQKAAQMLSQYAKIEDELLSLKRKYYKKMGKVIPASKVFRFAQFENRLDLANRLVLASSIPVLR